MIKAINGKTPKVDPSAFVAEGAQVLGDVELGPEVSIWYCAVLRGDINYIRVGARSNVQDGCVFHVKHLGQGVEVGREVIVGHNAVLHSCTVEDNALIGLGAVVLDHAVVGRGAVIAAGSVVPPGAVIPPRMLAMGIPAKPIKKVSDEMYANNQAGVRRYLAAAKCHADPGLRVDFKALK